MKKFVSVISLILCINAITAVWFTIYDIMNFFSCPIYQTVGMCIFGASVAIKAFNVEDKD